LLFEIGEATLSENPVAALDILERLLNCNVRLAVDDFGSGLAPLNHLVRMPIDVLKLSSGLTQAAAAGNRQSAVLESLIHLGAALGVQVIAEGIESAAQVEALMRMGCEFGEGSLLSPPLDLAAARKLAEQGL
jgi:EAL domain-containing protein (putative c-di-GMP-specific phosphodiesterase class I)